MHNPSNHFEPRGRSVLRGESAVRTSVYLDLIGFSELDVPWAKMKIRRIS